MTAFNPPLYDFPNLDFNPTIFEQGTTAFTSSSGGSGVDLLPTNNTWTGTNNFILGIITTLIDTLTVGTLSIGTAVADVINIGRFGFMTNILGGVTVDEDVNVQGSINCNNTVSCGEVSTDLIDGSLGGFLLLGANNLSQINIGKASTPTSIKGSLSVGGGTNTIQITGNSGLNRLLLSGSAGTSGQVLTTGGAGGNLSWASTGGSLLTTNNTWTGTNVFSNALGVTTSWIDRLAAGILSIGTSVASSITLGAAAIPTNIKGALTVGAGANTIALNANSGLNQLLLTGDAGTSGQVLTSGGAAGNLSWATGGGGGGVSLGGTNTWTALNTFSAGIALGSSQAITCSSLPTANANTATLLNNPFRSQTSASNPSLNFTKCGETAFLSLASNSGNLTGGTTSSPTGFLQILQATLLNAGVYTVSYLTTLNSSGGGNLIVASAYCESATPTPYSTYFANQSANYPGVGLDVSAFAIAQTGTFTSFFNAGTVLRSNVSINYVSGTVVPTNQRCFVTGTSQTNYLIITRIA